MIDPISDSPAPVLLPTMAALRRFFPGDGIGSVHDRCQAALTRAEALRCVPLSDDGTTLTLGVDEPGRLADLATALGRTEGTLALRILASEDVKSLRDVGYSTYAPDPKALELVAKSDAIALDVIPLYIANGNLVVGVVDRADEMLLARIRAVARSPIHALPASLEDIKERIQAAYAAAPVSVGASNIDTLVTEIFGEAVRARASDIHIDVVNDTRGIVKLRVDGNLRFLRNLPATTTRGLIDALLSRANVVNSGDTHVGHNGRSTITVQGRALAVRYATLPSVTGLTLVARIATSHELTRSLEEAGMRGALLARYQKALTYPFGLMIVAGPMGQGKSSFIHSSKLHIATKLVEAEMGRPLRRGEDLPLEFLPRSFRSLEQPVETMMPWIRQTQIDRGGRLSFKEGLEQFVRMDTDVMTIGEIREKTSLETSIEASLLGHYVFSTTHAGDSIRALQRLAFMGAPLEDLATGLVGILSMRLLRRFCVACRRQRGPATDEPFLAGVQKFYGAEAAAGAVEYVAPGCAACSGTGYSGRFGIFEYLDANEDVQQALMKKTVDRAVLRAADPAYAPMAADAIARILDGDTSLTEASRFVRFD